jgi:KaiC/GvpD/RAD55 family RecA-like ATPase
VKPPGFFQRLFGGFKVSFAVNSGPTGSGKSSFNIQTTVRRTFKIRDAATGETKEYHSLEEMPEKYREQVKNAFAESTVTQNGFFIGPDGVMHTYHSLDELPPEIRALVERTKKEL